MDFGKFNNEIAKKSRCLRVSGKTLDDVIESLDMKSTLSLLRNNITYLIDGHLKPILQKVMYFKSIIDQLEIKIDQREEILHPRPKQIIDQSSLCKNEEDWHLLLSTYPQIIENGLVFVAHEERTKHGIIDLHFKDKNSRDLIVEVKLNAQTNALDQILRYGQAYPNARLMIAAETFTDNLIKDIDDSERKIEIKYLDVVRNG